MPYHVALCETARHPFNNVLGAKFLTSELFPPDFGTGALISVPQPRLYGLH